MVARLVERTAKPGKRADIIHFLQNEVVPMLKKEGGFVDFAALSSDTDPDAVMTITMWEDKAAAERFLNNPEYKSRVLDWLAPLLQKPMTVHTLFNVEAATFHEIAHAKTA